MVGDFLNWSYQKPLIRFWARRSLDTVLNFFKELDKLDLNFDEGFRTDVLGRRTPQRPDEVSSSLGVEEVMASAPAKQGTSFLVPKILD